MTTERESWTPAGLATRVAGVQALLAIAAWWVVGYWTARSTWLLDPSQGRALALFFSRELPLLGAVVVVAGPAVWLLRLSRIVRSSTIPETSLLRRVLAYPRHVAAVDLGASLVLFVFAAERIRGARALPVEEAKVASFGLLSGVLFAVLSYCFLLPVIRPLVVTALGRGAALPEPPGFPLTRKLVLGSVAISFVVAGLFGELALFRAERHAEKSAGEQCSEALADLVAQARAEMPRDPASWRAFLRRTRDLDRGGTVFVVDSQERLIAISPPDVEPYDLSLVRTRPWPTAISPVSTRVRRVESRVLLRTRLEGTEIGILMPPDPAVMRDFVAEVVPVWIEAFLIAIVLSFIVGRSLARPLRELNVRTRAFGRNPEAIAPEASATDDEIGVLVHSTANMQEQIRLVHERLREMERHAATAELLAGVAHEVRNPLFGITSAASALANLLADDARVAPHLNLIARETRRLTRMMEEMLALERVPRGVRAPLTIRPVLDSAARSVRERLAAREPDIAIDSTEDLRVAEADPDRLESVFSNLFENAVLASPEAVRIRCRGYLDGDFAVIEVKDDGPGLSDDIRDRIFEPFVTSRPGGTGIGLAICRQVVAEHGGTIGVTSVPGDTVFSVRLPTV